LVAADTLRTLGIPWIAHFYGSDVSQRAHLHRARSGYVTVFREAAILLAEGPRMRERLLKLGDPESRIRIQKLSLDLRDYPFRLRQWPENRPLQILFVGRCVEKKGLEIALQAWALQPPDMDWRLTVIGDGPLRPLWEKLASHPALKGKVTFLGSRTLTEVRAALDASDLLIQPSHRAQDGDGEGGAPTLLLEAQACGLPILSTTHDDIPQSVLHGKSGWLVPEGDVGAWSEGWKKMLDLSSQWEAMGRAGREHISEHFNADINVPQLEELYREISG
jgi:colanic acid/amylovoran biosynthesis glycosyltransferase